MKKILILSGLVLLLALVVLLGCASVPIKPITEADLPDLKGKWKGSYTTVGYSYILPVELEINEYLYGRMTMGQLERGANTFPFYARLENGRMVCSWAKRGYINLSLRKGEGKMQLEGDWQSEDWAGTMFMYKIKE
jgi:hypothetical protein